MKEDKSMLYEGMYILSPALSEEARKKALDRIVAGITGRGGEVRKIHDQGRKKLAYEIRGSREGYYFLLYFTVSTSKLSELWREYHLNEDLLRFMTLKTESVMEAVEFKKLPEMA